jgi:hypothetical protein
MKVIAGHLVLSALLAAAAGGCNPKIQAANPQRTGGSGAAPGTGGAAGTGGGGGGGGAESDGGAGARGDGPGFGFGVPDGGGGAAEAGGPAGGGGSCAESTVRAQQVPLDLLVLMDNSSSMNTQAGGRSKWVAAQEALVGFARDGRSAGLGLGLQFFPYPPTVSACNADIECPSPAGQLPVPGLCRDNQYCVSASTPAGGPLVPCLPATLGIRCPLGGSCQPAGLCALSKRICLGVNQLCAGGIAGDVCAPTARVCLLNDEDNCEVAVYANPAVPIAALPANEGAFVAAVTARTTSGTTPTAPALQGAFTHLRGHLMRNPGRRAALIVATDGLPTSCGRVDPPEIAADIRTAAASSPAVSTYVIGVFAANEVGAARPALEMWAAAGGTGAPFIIDAGNDIGQRLQEALAQIRGSALPCEFTIPASTGAGPIDFGKVNVRLRTATGAEETILYVERANRCDPVRGGWYYDADPAAATPRRVLVCPATCARFKAEQNPTVSLVFGCKTEVIP